MQNVVSAVGFVLVAAALILLVTFALFKVVSPNPNPYFDIVGFLILPGIFVAGLAVVPLGMLWRFWRWRHAAHTRGESALPAVDLNSRSTRLFLGTFMGLTIFAVLPALAVTSYYGYGYTESAEFCGQVCHSVMEPQATAHSFSPHARVTCAECHIGSGASWFVKSKVSGVRQVFAVWRNSYSRPIPPAITELRPARDTCEECHWPAKFFGSQYREFIHYSSDERNTRRTVRMLVKTGGADPTMGRVEGIHMHMLWAGRIEYVATDEYLQVIPWVRFQASDGSVHIYRSDGQTSDSPPEGLVRQTDCMDCHNRGAHHFRSPQRAVSLYLQNDRIDATLPYVKREIVAALTIKYPDVAAAEAGIAQRLEQFYQRNYAEVWQTRRTAIAQAVAMAQELYRFNFFPEMNVSWQTYPENIGHLESPGCFRCHDGLHVTRDGRTIPSRCDVCHVALIPVEGAVDATMPGEFRHSMNMAPHLKLRCSQCHTGGELLDCRECHASGTWLEQAGQQEFKYEERS